ncbi:MAG: electron transfer flavoprotein subunit alpha/FixB family protein [Dehalococcoidia bacterium]
MMEPAYTPEEAKGIWVYLEQVDSRLEGVSLELLGKARELADSSRVELTAVLLGDQVEPLAPQAVAYGADQVLVADDGRLASYTTAAYTQATAQLILDEKPDILLLGATANGRDLAGRLAVRLRTGLTADCTGLALEPESGLLLGQVTGFGEGILATIKCPQHRPQMATVRPGVFAAPQPDLGRRGHIQRRAVNLAEEDLTIQVVRRVTARGVDLTSARVVVVGGRGVGGDFGPIKELATLLGGEVGATRVAVDQGWISREHQIGQTGLVTRPKLAITCGASGALQFAVGIEEAETVVAIDLDDEAPIFQYADYCITDDLFQVLPALMEEIRKATGNGGG